MASTATFECDYLHSRTSRIPHVFASEQAELTHISEQIHSLDSHISQLNAMREALHCRSYKLQNLLAPIHALPTEVLSPIFQHVVNSLGHHGSIFVSYHECLAQALVLSSVSARFRHVAFGTPELWKGVPLPLTDSKSIRQASSLLHHCMALAANISISVLDKLPEKQAHSAIEMLLTPNVTQKIKAFELYDSIHAPQLWIEKLRGPSFPILDTLDIACGERVPTLDLGSLHTLTRVGICELLPGRPIIMPPSVRYLNLRDVPRRILVAILYQCPNLEQCCADTDYGIKDFDDAQFDEPLTLAHLRHLTLAMKIITTASSAQNIQLPSLEELRFIDHDVRELTSIVLLCGIVSSTLTTLKIHIPVSYAVEYNEVYRLLGLPFPKLRKLIFAFDHPEPTLNIIRGLTQRAEECGNVQPHHLPSLTTLFLRCDDEMEPHLLLGLLEKWRVGEASCFNLKVRGLKLGPEDWSPGVREELRSIVGSRQVKVRWGLSKRHQFAFP